MAEPARPPRFDRLFDLLKVLLVQETFTLLEMKARLPDELPGYVTLLVHQLEREGHLRENDGVYSWTCELMSDEHRCSADAQEVVALKRITNTQDDAQAVAQAAREFLRLVHLRELKTASGTVEFDANWRQLEALELDEVALPR